MAGTAEPRTKQIEIVVDPSDPDRMLRYEDPISVTAGDRVVWICRSHDYGIQFTNNASPFQEGVISLSKVKGRPTDPCTARRTGRKRVAFKYSVTVHVPGSSNPIVTDDPVIIVDDG